MSSEKRAAANRRNAARSTGPKTPTGRAAAARNALAHGLTATAPVVPGEDPAGWDAHRRGVVAALAPAGPLEAALADRVAGCLWRLRRAVAYEAAVAVGGVEAALDAVADPPADDPDPGTVGDRLAAAGADLDRARETAGLWADTAALFDTLAGLPDDAPVAGSVVEGFVADLNGALPGDGGEGFDAEDAAFLAGMGVPADRHNDPWGWGGWTAGLARRAAAAVAAEFGADAAGLVARAAADRRRWQREADAAVKAAAAAVADLARRRDAAAVRAVVRRALPDAGTLDRVCRYEAHLSRQMLQALHTLERLQALRRAGRDVPPPAAGTLVVDPPLPPAGADGG